MSKESRFTYYDIRFNGFDYFVEPKDIQCFFDNICFNDLDMDIPYDQKPKVKVVGVGLTKEHFEESEFRYKPIQG